MREIKFRFWDKDLKKICERKPAYNDFSHPNIIPMQFTGFKDSQGKDIYDGDILSDWTKTDEGLKQSFCQVFWNKPTGSWHLDLSDSQNKTYSIELWLELHDYRYKVNGNVYETITKERESSD